MEIWKALTAAGASDTERGTALLRAKVAVQGLDSHLVNELVQLINREASLVLRQAPLGPCSAAYPAAAPCTCCSSTVPERSDCLHHAAGWSCTQLGSRLHTCCL